MPSNEYGKRFQESTRGRVVELLRIRSRTVEDLAQELRLTDNAVRTHLATLERDGVVQQQGVRRGQGAGKPATIFGIAPEAETWFSRAYVPLILALIDELAARQDEASLEQLMADVGRRLAAGAPVAAGPGARVELAVSLLRDLGALAEYRRENGSAMIVGHGCPLGLAVTAHPAVCRAVEAFVAAITGEPVHEQCDRNGRPSCRHRIGNSSTRR